MGTGDRGSRGSWGAELLPSFQPRILPVPTERREAGRDHVLSSTARRGSAPIHHRCEWLIPCTTAPQICKSSQLPSTSLARLARFRHFPGGAEQNPAASFQWGNSAEIVYSGRIPFSHRKTKLTIWGPVQSLCCLSVLGTEQSYKNTNAENREATWAQGALLAAIIKLPLPGTPFCIFLCKKHHRISFSWTFHTPLLASYNDTVFIFRHSTEEHCFLQTHHKYHCD